MTSSKKSMVKKDDKEIVDVNEKFNLLEKIAKLLTKYGYKKILTSLVIFILFIITIIIFTNQKIIIERIVKEQKQQQQIEEVNKLKFRLNEVTPRVDAILYKLLVQTNADRVFVIEMHNGTENLTGLPFIYGDMTYERLKSDTIEPIFYQYEKMKLSMVPLASYLMINRTFVGNINDLEKIDNRLAKKLKSNYSKYVAFYILRTLDVEIGWVGLIYCYSKPSTNEVIEGGLLDASQKLSILLDITNNIKE